ncbi:MAG TPA: IclR family transcriptional regulator [Chloroflexota bacterium]
MGLQVTTDSGVNSVVRALGILQAFTQAEGALSLGELSARVGMPKSSVHRLASTLEREGFLARHAENGRYQLGLAVLKLAGPALASIDLRQLARPSLEGLARELQDTVHLAVLDRGEVIYIDKIESPSRVQMVSHIGGRSPAHCTALGKVMLAYLREDEVEHIVAERGLTPLTSATITSMDALRAELEAVRGRGYAVDEGEHEAMVRCVAAPIHDSRRQVVGAVSVTTVVAGWKPEHRSAMTRAVVEAARAVSTTLGAPGSPESH